MAGSGVTCAAGAGTSTLSLDITCSAAGATTIVPIVNSDADGCTITVAETSAQLGCTAILELSSSAGGTVTVADVANILDVDGSWTPAVADNLVLTYEDLSNDRWQEAGRNKSWNAANDGSGSGLDADTVDALSSASFCQVSGVSACTMTGQTIYSGVTTDITAASAEDVTIAGGATSGSVVLQSIDNETTILDDAGNVDLRFVTANAAATVLIGQGTATSTGAVRFTSAAGTLGSQAAAAATTIVATIAESISASSSGSALASWYGTGVMRLNQDQNVACAAGVLALDPISSVVYLDANGAACAVTIAETSAATIGPGFDVLIVVTTSAGAGAVTFPDVANVHDGPTLCTTTGIALNGSYLIHYTNMANDMFVGVACSAN
jgi:hypothetical protein